MELIVTIAPSSLDSITAAVREQITQPDLITAAAVSNGSVAERLAKRFGAAVGEVMLRAVHSGPSLR
jgi:hypothetical protein